MSRGSLGLVQRIQAEDKSAESELVDKYWKSLYFVLKQRCKEDELASDIAQETLMLVITKARNGDIRNPEAISSFIRNTGINLLIAHFRKESRRATEANHEIVIDVPDMRSNVALAIESNQTLEMVQQLINEMKIERDRDILLSYYAREEEKDSICKRLGLSSAHFDRVLFRARARLKQLIDFRMGGENVFD